MRPITSVALGAALLLAARPASAQLTPREFRVAPRVGYVRFDPAASIENAPHFGLAADYAVTRHLSLGLSVGAAQPETRGDDFLTFQNVGDTTRILAVRQALDVFDFGANAAFHPGAYGRVSPFVSAGAGFYQIHLDPQVAGGLERVTKPMFSLGAGAAVRLAGSASLLLDVRDQVYTDYRRDRLFRATPADFPYAEFFPAARATKSTLNNLTFSIGFSFAPGAAAGGAGGDQ